MAGRVRSRQAAAPHGQHFLRSARLAAEIVGDAGVRSGDLVVDVGAGGGVLTAELLRRGARVVAIELDPHWAAHLRSRFGAAVEVVEGDARLRPWPSEPFKVVANIPFGGGTAIVRSLLEDARLPLVTADVVLQWEAAAKRAAAWPTTTAGVIWGAWYDVRVVRRLSRTAFAPPPAVDAGVLRATRRTHPLVPSRDAAAFAGLVRRGFGGTPLRRLVPPRTLKRLALELGFSPGAHARDLDARQWAALYASVRQPR